MLPVRVFSELQRIDQLVATLDLTVDEVDPIVQNVYANHVVLLASGYVENSTIQMLSEYGKNNGNHSVRRYIERTVSRNNSLNCEKIANILHHFDTSWWSQIEDVTPANSKTSVDSLKTLRDQIAHGKPNGTGYTTVKSYYEGGKRLVLDMCSVILA